MDCSDGMKQINKNSVDLIVTDPPYDVNYGEKSLILSKFGKARDKQIKRDENYKEFGFNYNEISFLFNKVLKENAHCYVFCADKQVVNWIRSMELNDFKYGGYLVWVKHRQTFDLSFGFNYNYSTELCLYFRKGVKKLNKLGLNNVMDYPTKNCLIHPAEKPEGMIRYLINNSSNEGDTVLDAFMGSGTTAVACKQMNRNFIGFEVSEEYCKIIMERLQQNTLLNAL